MSEHFWIEKALVSAAWFVPGLMVLSISMMLFFNVDIWMGDRAAISVFWRSLLGVLWFVYGCCLLSVTVARSVIPFLGFIGAPAGTLHIALVMKARRVKGASSLAAILQKGGKFATEVGPLLLEIGGFAALAA